MSYEQVLKMIQNVRVGEKIDNFEQYDPNYVFLAIIQCGKYGLFSFYDVPISIKDDSSSKRIVQVLLKDEDVGYYLKKNGYIFQPEVMDAMRNIAVQHLLDDRIYFENFFYSFFDGSGEVNEYIKNHSSIFEDIVGKMKTVSYFPSIVASCDEFIKIILKLRRTDLIKELETYSIDNLKTLVVLLKDGVELPYYYGTNELLNKMFLNKEQFTSDEFFTLLSLMIDANSYNHSYDKKMKSIETLIEENMDYIFSVIGEVDKVPFCLVNSSSFLEKCIQSKRMDLAVQCTLPEDILKREDLVEMYCQELHISKSDFYKRAKWLFEYYPKNKDLFDLMITRMLDTDFFSLDENHFERFINDPLFEIMLIRLNEKEKKIIFRLLNEWDYKTYDIANMVYHAVKNIPLYHELVETFELEQLTNEEFYSLITLLQDKRNYYHVTRKEELSDLNKLKNEKYEMIKDTDNIFTFKQFLVQYFFNVSYKKACEINLFYCYDMRKCIINQLENTELPKNVYQMLYLLNSIIDCNDITLLKRLYEENKDYQYNNVIPFDTYLKKKYTDLYSKSLFKYNEKRSEREETLSQVKYGDYQIPVTMMRDDFRFMIHCVGTCSGNLAGENFRAEWEDFPQVQDHFVACSYLSNYHLGLRDDNVIILGFDNLEGSSIHGMGNTDIDSIGMYSRTYNGGEQLMEGNGSRAHFFVPSMMLSSTEGYNEIVIERRNNLGNVHQHFKRMPQYIIMMSDSAKDSNHYMILSDYIEKRLSFLSDEERKIIIQDDYKGVSSILSNHIKEIVDSMGVYPNVQDVPKYAVHKILEEIKRAKFNEQCLKAAGDFGLPLLVVDKFYYYQKMLHESNQYSDEMKEQLIELYRNTTDFNRRKIYKKVALQKDFEEIMKDNQPKGKSISFTIQA